MVALLVSAKHRIAAVKPELLKHVLSIIVSEPGFIWNQCVRDAFTIHTERMQLTSPSFFGKAILGLIQVFTLNMIYFDIDSHNLFTHAIRRMQAIKSVSYPQLTLISC